MSQTQYKPVRPNKSSKLKTIFLSSLAKEVTMDNVRQLYIIIQKRKIALQFAISEI
jgi:hypothetical protein